VTTLLAIETSSNVCSVAVWRNGKVLSVKESSEKNAHSKTLTLMIQELLAKYEISKKNIDAIAVSMGPGSYTGLRIGVSVAKGLCYGWEKPLIAVDTIKALAAEYILKQEKKNFEQEKILLCPMFDARRMEVYTALYKTDLTEVLPVQALVVDESGFNEFLKENKILFFGNGATKCSAVIHSTNATFLNDIEPSARGVAYLAEKLFNENKFVDTAYFEPFYLKDFIAGKPSRKLF
jgi:tRNA threonylcarbamoyladenosine biosynthesis protein TsaB